MAISIVRRNLMKDEGYAPYCGEPKCHLLWPRTVFNSKQFTCSCGWKSDFPKDFIKQYKEKWGIE